MKNLSPEAKIIFLIVCAIMIPVIIMGIPVWLVFIVLIGLSKYFAIKSDEEYIDDNIEHFRFEQEYYTHIINKYSIGEIYYCDKQKYNFEEIVLSILLKLKIRNKIDVTEYGIIILDRKTEGLKDSEAYVLESISEDGFVNISAKKLKEKIKEELIKDELIVKAKKSKEMKIIYILIFIAYVILSYFIVSKIGFIFAKNVWIKTVIDIGNLIFVILSLPIFLFIYKNASYRRYIRTDKGKELNKKLENVKNYINKYSSLKEKQEKEFMIWEDYIIYLTFAGVHNIQDSSLYENIIKIINIKGKYNIKEIFEDII